MAFMPVNGRFSGDIRGELAMAKRIAALYDIHGNLPALESVLAQLAHEDLDEVVIGGDLVPGPMVRETMVRLQELEVRVHYIRGNCEVAVLSQISGPEPAWYTKIPESAKATIRWQAQQLDPALERLMTEWPMTYRTMIDGLGAVLFCHATPRHENEVFTNLTPEERLRPLFEHLGVDLVVCGHTHMQFDRMVGTTRVVNAGSVGMPFGEPGADWLMMGPEIDLRHTPYDLERAAERVRSSGYPEDFAERYILNPPAAAAMVDALTAFSLQESAGRW
jgi:putative phosphoesterase